MIDLPLWTSAPQSILDYIAGMPFFRAEGLTAGDLARAQRTEPFLFLLNGWNEIAESNSAHANNALRELERHFPTTGIILATRTHHLTPPLPGSTRLRLQPLRQTQRANYLTTRLGPRAAELCTRIDRDPCLDELTRMPFILSEVTSLFAAEVDIPPTKVGVLTQVLHLHEQQDQHRNALKMAPLYGRQTDYLTALATEMTRRGATALIEADALEIVARVARELATSGQVGRVPATTVLTTLTAHHVLELVDYPQAAFRFEHQQLQEYFAALHVHTRLLALGDDNLTRNFTADYVNRPVWAEPLRMVAQILTTSGTDHRPGQPSAGPATKLLEMALNVDLVFAGELAQLCGPAVWHEIRAVLGDRLRSVHALPDANYRQYAVAAMLATGAHDFSDIITPLLAAKDQQTRLAAYRLRRDIRTSSLGPNWQETVRSWNEEVRADFVSELLHHRLDDDIAALVIADESVVVKKAAVSALVWNRSDDALLIRVLGSLDAQTLDRVACENADLMPLALRPKTVVALRRFIGTTADPPKQLRAALKLIALGETGLDGVIRDAVAALPARELGNLGTHYLQPALEHLRNADPAWASEWFATQVAAGALYNHESWLRFATPILEHVVEKCLQRLETEELQHAQRRGTIAVVAASASAEIAARIIAKLRELQRKVDAECGRRAAQDWQIIRQLETLFRHIPADMAARGLISSVTHADALDIKVAAALLSRVARPDVEPLRIADARLKSALRAYLTGSVDLVLCQDDIDGTEKANLSSSIAQVGESEDMRHLLTLIHADIERMRRVRAAAAAGDRALLHAGGNRTHARWHLAALKHLDPAAAELALVDLLNVPEYRIDVAAAMAQEYLPAPKHPLDTAFPYDLVWAARDFVTLPSSQNSTRTRYATALKAGMDRLKAEEAHRGSAADVKRLANALAAVGGRGSAERVLDVVAVPGQRDEHTRVAAAERLLIAGVVLPTSKAFPLADSILARPETWAHDSDKHLLGRVLSLCVFVDDPAAGIAKVRDALRDRPLVGYQLRGLINALGRSRSEAAADLLSELVRDPRAFTQCEDYFVNAFAALDTPRARELLLSFVDPEVDGIPFTPQLQCENLLVGRLTELAERSPAVATRLHQLCDRDLPDINRRVVSTVMGWLGASQALTANLNLIADNRPEPVPRGVWKQLESAFVGQRPYGQDPHVATLHARASNDVRLRLFHMVLNDPRRRKSASMLLGEIELWRLEYGRPPDEPRHPDLASGHPWPPAS